MIFNSLLVNEYITAISTAGFTILLAWQLFFNPFGPKAKKFLAKAIYKIVKDDIFQIKTTKKNKVWQGTIKIDPLFDYLKYISTNNASVFWDILSDIKIIADSHNEYLISHSTTKSYFAKDFVKSRMPDICKNFNSLPERIRKTDSKIMSL